MARRPTKIKEMVPGLWQILRHFWPHIRRQRSLIGASLGALFLGIVFRLLTPWPLAFVLDCVIRNKIVGGWAQIPGIEKADPAVLLMLAALAVVIISLLRGAADYYSKVGFFLIGNRVVIKVRNEVYCHLHALSLSFHTKAKRGDLIVRVTRDVSLLRDVISTAVLPLLANVLVLVGMMAVMFYLQWQLALLAMVTLPLFWLTTARLGRRIRETAHKQREREGAMASLAAESLGAMEVVQALSLEETFVEDFANRNQKSQKEDLKANRLSARLGRIVDVLLSIGTALVMWYGAHLVLRGQLTLGALIAFMHYIKQSFKPAQNFAKYTARLAKATAAGARVIDILQRKPKVCDLPDAVEAPAFQGRVQLVDVSFGYDRHRLVLEHVSFDVEPGQHVVVAGPSGIGKSTLMSLILRLYDVTDGKILIDGHDIREVTLRSLRRQISVVPQDTVLFACSARDNIACGTPDATAEEIEEVARLANAHEFIEQMAEGYDTVLGERGVTLSHGQRQRIAIARAAIRKTPILILDEPTTGLDEENERAVVDALLRLTSGRTTFIITHNLQLTSDIDLVLYLEDGRLSECGTHAQLMQTNGRYSELYRQQARASSPAM